MKARLALFLCACSTACAESPPVVNSSGSLTADQSVNTIKPPASLANDYSLMKRIEQLQTEVQKLTGKVDEQAYYIDELKKQQKTMYTDFDDRLQSLENKSGSGQPSTDVPVEPTNPSDPSSGSTEIPVPPPAPDAPTSSSQPKNNAVEQAAPAAAPPPAVVDSPSDTDGSASQASEFDKQEYQQAYDDLRNGRTDKAIAGFNAYIASHPQGTYASNAQYWLGEAHRVNQDNASARQAFQTILDNYPSSQKAPDALLKLGYIEMEEKNPVKAREYLNRVFKEFPGTKAAGLAQQKLLILDKSAL